MRIGLIAAALLVSACVLPEAKSPANPTANPITGDAISTSALSSPAATAPVGKVIGEEKQPAAKASLATPMAQQVDASQDAIEAAAAPKPPVEAAPAPETVETPAVDVPPPVPQSPAEAKCLKTGGVWATAGKGEAKACVKATRDGGKSCSRQTQCEGLCLARSATCAPITPLFGCNDVFEADGRRVTLCLE